MGNRAPIAQVGALDAQLDGLGVDALGSGALGVDVLIGLAAAVDLVAQACALAGGQGGAAALLGPTGVVDGALLAAELWEAQRAAVALAGVRLRAAALGERGVLAVGGRETEGVEKALRSTRFS